MKKSILSALLLCCWLLVGAQMPMRPAFYTPINDFANLLNRSQEEELSQQLRQYEQTEGEQLVFVTVQHLGGATVETFAQQLYNGWGIGKDSKGLLVLVSVEERKARIQVGRGLETKWPLEKRELLLRNKLLPSLKKNDYFQAFWETTQTLLNPQLLEQLSSSSGLVEQPQTVSPHIDNSGIWWLWGLIGLFSIIFGTMFYLIFGNSAKKTPPLHSQSSNQSYKKSQSAANFINYGQVYDPGLGQDPNNRSFNSNYSGSSYDNNSSGYDNNSSYDSSSGSDSSSSSSDWGGGSSDSGSSSDY